VRLVNQALRCRVINYSGNRPISSTLEHFINDVEWHQEPFARFDRVLEAVFNGQGDLCRAKQAVKEVFQLGAVQ